MPPVRSATAASRARSASGAAAPRSRPAPARPRRLSGPRRLIRRSSPARVRWDRVGRVALLVVLGIVALLYVQHALSYFSARRQLHRQTAIVRSLQRQNAQLEGQARSLTDPATIVAQARRLGMVKLGERAYSITGQ